MLGKVPHQIRNIVAALAQRRHRSAEKYGGDSRDPRETALLDHRQQIAVGRRDQADVGMPRARGAQALEGVLLQDAQKLGLQLQGEVANFVEEEGPPIGQFKASETLGERPRERPFFVAKEFGFQQAGEMAAQLSVTKGHVRRPLQ